MWLDLINKAKRGGLNVIQTYVFWNIHEPVQGQVKKYRFISFCYEVKPKCDFSMQDSFFFMANSQFNFEGNYDVVKFIKLIGEQGMYVTLRIGPYIEAEWNQGYK